MVWNKNVPGGKCSKNYYKWGTWEQEILKRQRGMRMWSQASYETWTIHSLFFYMGFSYVKEAQKESKKKI